MYMFPHGLNKTGIPYKVPQNLFLIHAYVKDCVMPNIYFKRERVVRGFSLVCWLMGQLVVQCVVYLSPSSCSRHSCCVPEQDLSTQEYYNYWKAAWADLGYKYKTSSRYYYSTSTFIYTICKCREICALVYACVAACYCMHFLKVESNLYTCKVLFFIEKKLVI